MFRLRFTTLVEAPLTVAFDVARTLGRPWCAPLEEVVSVRPVRDVYASSPGQGRGWVTHSRRFSPTGAGTQIDEQVDWETGLPGVLGGFVDQVVVSAGSCARCRRTSTPTRRRPRGWPSTWCRSWVPRSWTATASSWPSARADRSTPAGSSPAARSSRGVGPVRAGPRVPEELGVAVEPQAFVGEVLLDGVVAGGAPGASTLRVWSARIVGGGPVAHEHAQLRWVPRRELEDLDWIAADRPLLPAVRRLLHRL